MPTEVPVNPSSFLGAYTKSGAFTDCYAVEVQGIVSLTELIEAFYTTPLFKVERWLLARFLKFESTDAEAAALAKSSRTHFSAWKVEQRAEQEILLKAGRTRSWLAVVPSATSVASTRLLFGSAVVPMQRSGQFGFAFHALLSFHKLYSRLLLGAAAKRLQARQFCST